MQERRRRCRSCMTRNKTNASWRAADLSFSPQVFCLRLPDAQPPFAAQLTLACIIFSSFPIDRLSINGNTWRTRRTLALTDSHLVGTHSCRATGHPRLTALSKWNRHAAADRWIWQSRPLRFKRPDWIGQAAGFHRIGRGIIVHRECRQWQHNAIASLI
jgi:hypothetical protein